MIAPFDLGGAIPAGITRRGKNECAARNPWSSAAWKNLNLCAYNAPPWKRLTKLEKYFNGFSKATQAGGHPRPRSGRTLAAHTVASNTQSAVAKPLRVLGRRARTVIKSLCRETTGIGWSTIAQTPLGLSLPSA